MKHYKHPLTSFAAAAGIWLVCTAGAQAQAQVECESSAPPILDFGEHGLLASKMLTVASTPFAFRCHNHTQSSQHVYICISLGHGSGGIVGASRIMVNGSNQAKYQLYKTAAYDQIWGTDFNPAQNNSLVQLPALNIGPTSAAQTQSMSIYGRMFIEQPSYPAGTYLSLFTQGLMPGWQVTYAVFTAGIDDGAEKVALSQGTVCHPKLTPQHPISVDAFQVRFTSIYYCNIITQNVSIHFGNHHDLFVEHTAFAPFQLQCGQGVDYKIGINLGLPTHHNLRIMRGGQENEDIVYQLYRDPKYTMIWGDIDDSVPNGSVHSGTGTGTVQTHPIYAKTPGPSGQIEPSPHSGLYTSNAVITVSY